MIDNKISLTFILPGGILLSSQECEKNPKRNYTTHKLMIEDTESQGKKKKKVLTPLVFKTRNTRTITQHVNMNTDAYQYMLNTPSDPKLIRVWGKMSKHDKLKHHLDLIAHDLHAISYKYEILED
jgi:hypothetical protein